MTLLALHRDIDAGSFQRDWFKAMFGPQLSARFEHETSIAAKMPHPDYHDPFTEMMAERPPSR